MTARKWSRSILIMLFMVFVVAGLSLKSASAAGASPLIVDSGWLSAHSGKIVVVDVRNGKSYLKGHIPGSISIPVNELQTKPDAIMFSASREEKILGKKGLRMGSDVVLVGAGREMAYLEFWMLDYLGMPRLHVLNGGMEEWKGQLATAETKLPPAVFKGRPNPSRYATTAYIRSHLHATGVVLLDVRSPEEFAGTDVRALRGGHIPGAVNMNYVNNYVTDTTLLKPVSELKKIYSKLDRRKEYVTYCQTGTRAANSYFVLRALGFKRVRVYDASWIVWGSDESLPADDVSYFNFVPLLNTVKKLQKKVDALEKAGAGK